MDPTEPSISFPVIRGLQAQREYFVAMWTLRTLSKISIFDEDELPPEMRAQREISAGRRVPSRGLRCSGARRETLSGS